MGDIRSLNSSVIPKSSLVPSVLERRISYVTHPFLSVMYALVYGLTWLKSPVDGIRLLLNFTTKSLSPRLQWDINDLSSNSRHTSVLTVLGRYPSLPTHRSSPRKTLPCHERFRSSVLHRILSSVRPVSITSHSTRPQCDPVVLTSVPSPKYDLGYIKNRVKTSNPLVPCRQFSVSVFLRLSSRKEFRDCW